VYWFYYVLFNYSKKYLVVVQEQIKLVDKETDWLDDTDLEEQQCNSKTSSEMKGFFYAVIFNG
jgi:hypothetical protein